MLLATVASAAAPTAVRVELTGALIEGGVVFGKTEPGANVTLDGRSVRVAKDGRFVFGFGRDAPTTATLEVHYSDGTVTHMPLQIATRQYEIQKVEGLPQKLVTPSPEEEARIAREQAEVTQARTLDLDEPLFESKFIWPALGPISGVYGSQRILNGTPRAPHPRPTPRRP